MGYEEGLDEGKVLGLAVTFPKNLGRKIVFGWTEVGWFSLFLD